MSKIITKLAFAAAASAALGFAAPASAAMQLNSDGTVTVSGTGGGSVFLSMNGNSEGVDYANLSSSIQLTYDGIVDGAYRFSYTLTNTSSNPITSRLNAFGFNTNPELTGAAILTGSVLTDIRYDTNLPNGIGNVDICFTTNNCAGGGQGGLTNGQATNGSFALSFGSTNLQSITLSNFAVRYQALNVGSGSGTGRLITNAVPEPGTWAMMLLGFGAIGIGMRRRRVGNILQMA